MSKQGFQKKRKKTSEPPETHVSPVLQFLTHWRTQSYDAGHTKEKTKKNHHNAQNPQHRRESISVLMLSLFCTDDHPNVDPIQ
jgi:hypothetical protein